MPGWPSVIGHNIWKGFGQQGGKEKQLRDSWWPASVKKEAQLDYFFQEQKTSSRKRIRYSDGNHDVGQESWVLFVCHSPAQKQIESQWPCYEEHLKWFRTFYYTYSAYAKAFRAWRCGYGFKGQDLEETDHLILMWLLQGLSTAKKMVQVWQQWEQTEEYFPSSTSTRGPWSTAGRWNFWTSAFKTLSSSTTRGDAI